MSTIACTDPNIVYSDLAPPAGAQGVGYLTWFMHGSGTGMACANPAYFEFWLNCPASDTVAINFASVPALGGLIITSTYLGVIVDGLPTVYTAVNGLTTLTLGTGLTAGVHTFRIEVSQCNTNQWDAASSAQVLFFESITTGGTTVAVTTAFTKVIYVVGDSRASGSLVWAPSTTPSQDFSLSFVRHVCRALGYECASSVYPGIGFLTGTRQAGQYWPGNVNMIPGFFTPATPADSSWNLIWDGSSRTWPSWMYSVWICGLGTNDALSNLGPTIGGGGETAAQLTASVAGLLAAYRSVIPANCMIWLTPPWSGAWNGLALNSFAALQAAIYAGFTTYQAATPDPLCYWIPITLNAIEQAQFYSTSAAATTYTSEGLHPTLLGHEYLVAPALAAIQAAVQPGPPVINKVVNQYFYNEVEP